MLPHPEQLVLQPMEEGTWSTVTRHTGKGKRTRVEHIKVGTQGTGACVGVSVRSGATQGSSAARGRTKSKGPGLLVSAHGGRFSGTPGSGVSSSANFPHGHGRITHPNMFTVLKHPRDSSTGVCASFEEEFTAEMPRKTRMPRKKGRSDSWITERYTVRSEVVEEILQGLAAEPTVDVLADEGAHVLPKWLCRGGESLDAGKELWDFSKQGVLWMNPPFGRLKEVVQKNLERWSSSRPCVPKLAP